MPARPSPIPRAFGVRGLPLLCLTVMLACGGTKPPPGPGQHIGMVPDLRGLKVMVFPLQAAHGFDRMRFEPEMNHALATLGPGIEWVLPEDLRRIRERTPGLDMEVENLPVGVFLQAEVRRIGDPLYGYLRRLGAVANSDIALVPVGGGKGIVPPPSDDPAFVPAELEVAATLIDARSGRVLWYGVVEGDGDGLDDPRTLASAAEALARLMAPYSGVGR